MSALAFGDDRSPGADLAWGWCNAQHWSGWDLDVVTVTRSEAAGEEDGLLAIWVPDEARAVHPDAGFGAVRNLTAAGDPRSVLASMADAALVVVGATGGGLVRRVLRIGSTAESLVHRCQAPVLIARHAAPTRRVLLAVDGSESADRAVATFLDLPWAATTEVLAVGAWDGWGEPEEGLERAADALDAAGVSHRVDQVRGHATEVVLDAAEEHRSDLVVVGARGRSRFHRVLSGSTAAAVVRAADAGVLVVP